MTTEPTASVIPNAKASPGRMRPAGTGRAAVRVITASMSASYHMLSAPAAPAPTAMHEERREPDHRMEMAGRDHEADERREHDERHHARLHQREIVADARDARLAARMGGLGNGTVRGRLRHRLPTGH